MANQTTPFTVAAAQAAPYFLDRDKTVDKACELIKEAGKNNAKLIVFPEAFYLRISRLGLVSTKRKWRFVE